MLRILAWALCALFAHACTINHASEPPSAVPPIVAAPTFEIIPPYIVIPPAFQPPALEGLLTSYEPPVAVLATTAAPSAIAAAVTSAPAGTEQWRELASAIFPAHTVDRLLQVMACESGGRATAHNTNAATKDDSVGLLQINLFGDLLAGRMARLAEWGYDAYDRDSTVAVLMQPEANLRMAHYISGGGASFGAWSCGR